MRALWRNMAIPGYHWKVLDNFNTMTLWSISPLKFVSADKQVLLVVLSCVLFENGSV